LALAAALAFATTFSSGQLLVASMMSMTF